MFFINITNIILIQTEFDEKIKLAEKSSLGFNQEENVITLQVDRVRGPEIYF